MSMFTHTKNLIFVDRIMAIVDQARDGAGMAETHFDLEKAEAAAAAYAELPPFGLPGMPLPKVDAPALMELARGLREGVLAECTITELQYQQFIAHFCADFHSPLPYVKDFRNFYMMYAYQTMRKHTPPRRMELTIDTEMELPALKAFLKEFRASTAARVDNTKKFQEAEQQRLGYRIVGVELKDLSTIQSEIAACNDFAKVMTLQDDWVKQFHIRSHMTVTLMLGRFEGWLEFLDVSIQAVSELMAAKEEGSMAGGDTDEKMGNAESG
ncbi:hypothetical protein NCS52_00470400 [Fusarium sp. LHS14.1]|nr:hypothetical protein NCS52_00470400 [Fusarium sp. LHS14.1]